MVERVASKRSLVVRRWLAPVVVLLLAWAVRMCCLEGVPPGWRDDELINIHALAGEVAAGSFPLYFLGASGHEPLYHYVHAAVLAALGTNVLGGHLLSAALGLLSIALTYVLASRLLGRGAATIASLGLATSFWSLMYSRIALRHVSLLPFALLSFYLFWRGYEARDRSAWAYVGAGVAMGLALHTYFASRLLPLVFLVFLLYLLVFHRGRFRRERRGLLLTLGIALIIVAPMALTVATTVGADPRVAELAAPLRDLWTGNPRPLWENTVQTIGMFTSSGDPEWLYNLPGRPVFNLLGGALLWVGVAICVVRWRQPAYFFLVCWFAAGLAPAFVSVPPASLSHTILAQPVTYMLPALAIFELGSQATGLARKTGQGQMRARRLGTVLFWVLAVPFLATNAYRDLRDYFVVWPRQSLVRFLYRADYRDIAQYLDERPDVVDVAVGSTLLGPWDRLALEADTSRDDVSARLFDPERALVWVEGGEPAAVFVTDHPRPGPPLDTLIETAGEIKEQVGRTAMLYELPAVIDLSSLACAMPDRESLSKARFGNGWELMGLCWEGGSPAQPGTEARLITVWRVASPLILPPAAVVANPPPPGAYAGPRLSVFVHLLADDASLVAGEDGLWVDPLTLRPGDRLIQVHRFVVGADAPAGPYVLELGLFDPMTGERWPVLEAAVESAGDRLLLSVEELASE